MKIGVLALQGDFREHCAHITSLGADCREVRLPDQLDGLDGLILPGGESTTISKLILSFGLLDPLLTFSRSKAIWGTCAGAILMAKECSGEQNLLKLMDMRMERNAFGRQVDSFESDLSVPFLQSPEIPYHAVFIRAPVIEAVSGDARALLCLPDGRIVAAQQGRFLATSFHPEMTTDLRFHQYFLELARSAPDN